MTNYSLTIKERKQGEKLLELIRERIIIHRTQDPHFRPSMIWMNPELHVFVLRYLKDTLDLNPLSVEYRREDDRIIRLFGVAVRWCWDETGFTVALDHSWNVVMVLNEWG